jgi:2-keto-4-pentenoate hydratase
VPVAAGPVRVQAGRLAAVIRTAHLARRLLDPDATLGPIDLATAYDIQAEGLALRLAAGERQVGWKIGYTSAAMRAQMRVDAPNFGPLTDRMLLADGDAVGPALTQPRVEPEILVILGDDVPGGAGRDRVAGSVAEARAALEVVDSVWQDYRFRLEDNTADGSSAAHAVVGPPLPEGTDLAGVAVSLTGADGERQEARGDAAFGHPLDAVRWLAGALAAQGGRLRAGDLVLTGGLTAALPLPSGGRISAAFSGAGEVAVRREADVPPLRTATDMTGSGT